jgi:hypothetical protein
MCCPARLQRLVVADTLDPIGSETTRRPHAYDCALVLTSVSAGGAGTKLVLLLIIMA